jgi:hypothetical protein
MARNTKTMTVRLPERIYADSSRLAHRRQVSLNHLIQESLEHELKREDDQHLYDAFTQLGEDAEEYNVEYAIAAQREVIDRAER